MAGVTEGDRKRVIKALRRHAARGQLSDPELNDRIQRAERALTHAGLDGILLDLPPAPSAILGPHPAAPEAGAWAAPTAAAPPSIEPSRPPSSTGPWSMPGEGGGASASGPWSVPTAAPAPLGEHGPWRRPPPPKPPRVVGDGRPFWWRPTTYGALGLVALAALAMWGISMGVDNLEPNEPNVSPVTVPETAPRRTPPPTERITPEPTPAPPPAPPPTMPSWEPVILQVGREIQPGRYTNTLLVDMCYWERVHGLGGTLDDVIANGNGPHSIVDVRAGDVGLVSRGCGDWKPYAPPPSPATAIGEGDWLVGSDVAAGTYRVTSPGPEPTLCVWERGRGFAHDFDELIESGFSVPDQVHLGNGERFTTSYCGTWTRV